MGYLFLIILSLQIINSELAIIDTRPKTHKEGCSFCENIAKERCQTGGKGDALCQKIAHDSCPTKILKASPLGEDTEEILDDLQVAQQQQRDDNKGVFDLVNGILLAAHTSAKADLRRAKEKELKDEIFKKVAAF